MQLIAEAMNIRDLNDLVNSFGPWGMKKEQIDFTRPAQQELNALKKALKMGAPINVVKVYQTRINELEELLNKEKE